MSLAQIYVVLACRCCKDAFVSASLVWIPCNPPYTEVVVAALARQARRQLSRQQKRVAEGCRAPNPFRTSLAHNTDYKMTVPEPTESHVSTVYMFNQIHTSRTPLRVCCPVSSASSSAAGTSSAASAPKHVSAYLSLPLQMPYWEGPALP